MLSATLLALAGAPSEPHNQSRQQTFDDVYARHTWGSASLSGPGSTLDGSAGARAAVLTTFKRICKAKQQQGSRCTLDVLDAACGDMTWMPLVLEQAAALGISVSYTGADVSQVVLGINRADAKLHARLSAATSSHTFVHLDLVAERLPRAYDLVLARHVLMHLSNGEIAGVLRNVRSSGSHYLLATNSYVCEANGENLERSVALARDLSSAPFALPASAVVASYQDADGPLALWKLELLKSAAAASHGASVCQLCGCSAPLGGGVLVVPPGARGCNDAEIRRCNSRLAASERAARRRLSSRRRLL
jgi:2-polyprenyl-3-methyl-5-hydroxy-6-metoxy-1,4-benzoquinol methylase